MIKKTVKVLSIVLALILSLGLFACKGNDNGSTTVGLKTPGAVISNNGAVIETENYFYFINGQEDGANDNTYGTPVKGSIMVTAKSDLSTSEIVVPKIVSSEDYNAGIYLFGEYLYYGTTNVEKDSNGNVPKDILTFQKAKIDGSSVENILSVKGLNTTFRFAQVNGTVYLIYTKVSTENDTTVTSIYCYNVSNGSEVLVTDNATAYVLGDNDEVSSLAVVYTESVKKYPNISDNTETESYNIVKAFKAGDSASKTVLKGDRASTGLSTDVSYTIADVRNGYVFVASSYVSGTLADTTVAVTYADLYDSTPETQKNLTSVEVLNAGHISDCYFVSLDNVYYSDANGDVVKASLTGNGADATIVASVTVTKFVGIKTYGGVDYLYYLNADSILCGVELSEDEPKDEVIVFEGINVSWYSVKMVGDYLVWSNSAAGGKQYITMTNVAENKFVTDEDDVITFDGDVITLGKKLDADVAAEFNALVENFKAGAYDVNQRVNVRDENGNLNVKDGKVYAEGFAEVKAFYDAMTDNQKSSISEDAKHAYDLYIECFDYVNQLYKLNGFIADNGVWAVHTKEEWKAIATQVKDYIDAKMQDADYESIFNMADNNLAREYWGNKVIDGAQDVFFGSENA